MTSDLPASDVYELAPHRMSRPRRWGMMAVFWFMALISLGNATPVPSTNAWAIVRKSDGTIVLTVDDEMAGEASVEGELRNALNTMTQREFDDAWGITAA